MPPADRIPAACSICGKIATKFCDGVAAASSVESATKRMSVVERCNRPLCTEHALPRPGETARTLCPAHRQAASLALQPAIVAPRGAR